MAFLTADESTRVIAALAPAAVAVRQHPRQHTARCISAGLPVLTATLTVLEVHGPGGWRVVLALPAQIRRSQCSIHWRSPRVGTRLPVLTMALLSHDPMVDEIGVLLTSCSKLVDDCVP